MSPLRVAAVGAYVGTIFLVAASIVVAALLLPHPAAVAWLALLVRERRERERGGNAVFRFSLFSFVFDPPPPPLL